MADRNIPRVGDITPVTAAAKEMEAELLGVLDTVGAVHAEFNAVGTATEAAGAANVKRVPVQKEMGGLTREELANREGTLSASQKQIAANNEMVGSLKRANAELARFNELQASSAVHATARAEAVGAAALAQSRAQQAAFAATPAQQRAAGGWVRGAAPPPPDYSGGWATPAGGFSGGPPPPPPPAPPSGPTPEEEAFKRRMADNNANNRTAQLTSAELGRQWQINNAQLTAYNNTLTRHGYLTSEVISAARRGELTYAEWGTQIAGTAAKFAAWTAVSIPIFAALGAFKEMYTGAVQTGQGIAFMQRSIDNLDTNKATAEIQQLSQHFNVTIEQAAQAIGIMGRIYHSQGEATSAAAASLYAVKLGGKSGGEAIDVTTSATELTAIVNAFKLPASDLQIVFDQINSAQLRFGTSLKDTMNGLALAGGAYRTAGGDLTTLLGIISAINRETHASGSQIGTAVAQSIAMVNNPKNVKLLDQLGLKEQNGNWQKLLMDAMKLAEAHPEEAGQIAAAFGGARQRRLFAPFFADPQRFLGPVGTGTLSTLDPNKNPNVRGASERELQTFLAGTAQQISRIGTNLQNIGSSLNSSGALDSLGGMLKLVNGILTGVHSLIEVFNNIPDPFRSLLSTGAELYGVVRLLKSVNIGQGFGALGGTRNVDAAGNATSLTGRGYLHQWFTQNPDKENAKSIVAQAGQDAKARESEFTRAKMSENQAVMVAQRSQQAYRDKFFEFTNAEPQTLNDSEYAGKVNEAQHGILQKLRNQAMRYQDITVELGTQSEWNKEILVAQEQIYADLLKMRNNPGAVISYARGDANMGAFKPLPYTGEGGPVTSLSALEKTAGGVVLPVGIRDVGGTALTRASVPVEAGAGANAILSKEASTAAGGGGPEMVGKLLGDPRGTISDLQLGSLAQSLKPSGFMGGLMTYFMGQLGAQLAGSVVGGKAGQKVTSLGTDAAIGAAAGTVIPVVGPVLGAIAGVGGGLLADFFASTNRASKKEREKLTNVSTLAGFEAAVKEASTYYTAPRFGGSQPGLADDVLQQDRVIKFAERTNPKVFVPTARGGQFVTQLQGTATIMAEAEKVIRAAKTRQQVLDALDFFDAELAVSYEASHAGGKQGNRIAAAAKAQLGFLAANGAGAGPASFLTYYNDLGTKGQAAWDTYMKDTIAQQGLNSPQGHTLEGQGTQAATWLEAKAALYMRYSRNDKRPDNATKDMEQATAYAREAASITTTVLSQNTSDLADALLRATDPSQVAQAFRDAIANARSQLKTDPKHAKAQLAQLGQQMAQHYNAITTSQANLQNAYDPNTVDVATNNIAADGVILQRDIRRFHAGSQQVIDAMAKVQQDNLALTSAHLSDNSNLTALAVAQAGNSTAGVDAANVAGAQRALGILGRSSQSAKAKSQQAVPLMAALLNAQTTAANDAIATANALDAANNNLAAANAGTAIAVANANVHSASETLARGGFKNPADRVTAEVTLQNAKNARQQQQYQDFLTNATLTRQTPSQEIDGLMSFAKRVKKGTDLWKTIMGEIINLENTASGSYELNVGNIALPTAYQVRRAQHGLKYSNDTMHSEIHVHGGVKITVDGAHSPHEVAHQVSLMLSHGVRGAARASSRSSLLR